MSLTLRTYLKKWDLSHPKALAETRTSQVYLVSYRGAPAVLKVLSELGRKDEASSEIALRLYGGKGAVSLFESDPGALLLSFADGELLKSIVVAGNDVHATEVLCQVLSQPHSAPVAEGLGLRSLSEAFGSLFQAAARRGADPMIVAAASCASKLMESERDQVILHGDIHHKNVIHSSIHGWQAIDPKGLFGERTYDLANVFYNPDDMPDLVEQAVRIESLARKFSECFGLDRKRILEFAFSFGCLSSCWAIEDGLNPGRRLRIARIIYDSL